MCLPEVYVLWDNTVQEPWALKEGGRHCAGPNNALSWEAIGAPVPSPANQMIS